MKLRSGVNVLLLFNFVSATVDFQTGAAVAPDNRTVTSSDNNNTTVTSPGQSSSLALSASSSPTRFGTSRFGTHYNFELKLDIQRLKTHLC